MNMKIKRFSLFFSILILSKVMIFAQPINHSQELADLISTKKWFEIENYYQQYKDSLDSEFVLLWYLAETGNAFNRSDEAIKAYEKLIDNNPLDMDILTLISLFGQPLLQLCANVHEYAKGEEICQKFITILERDTAIDTDTRLSVIEGFTEAIESFKLFPKTYPKLLKITKNEADNIGEIKLILPTLRNDILFKAKWNGIGLRTIFDTGSAAEAYIYNRAIAEKIGVKLNTADTIITNESYRGSIRMLTGVIDNLELGDFNIKNVTVFVSIETIDSTDSFQVRCDSLVNSMFDIVLGIPIIKQLGVIEFDFIKNTMSFSQKTKNINKRNLYIENNLLFMNVQVCNADFLNHFDTGNSDMSINTDFYENHKQCISIASQITREFAGLGACSEANVKYREMYNCPQIEIEINDQIITIINGFDVAKDKENDNVQGADGGGFIGNTIFKYCKKATFDFDNMVFYVEKW